MENPNILVESIFGPMIVNIHDQYIGGNIRAHGFWAVDDIKLIQKCIEFLLETRRSVMFYDVGANIGTHTLALSKTFESCIKLRAFEPQRQIYNMLCGNMALNGLTNALCHNNAVSNVGGEVIEIATPNYNIGNNFGALELAPPKVNSEDYAMKKTGKVEKVFSLTLDSFDEVVDFIKIDVEGMEDKVVLGAVNTIDRNRPFIYAEIHKTDSEFLKTFFAEKNYHGYRVETDILFVPAESEFELDGYEKVF